jgi:hypothetical protein
LGVRGTDFSVAVTNTGDATVAVDSGTVAVFEPESRRVVELAAGEALAVRERVLEQIDRRRAAISDRLAEFEQLNLTDVPRDALARTQNAFDYFSQIEVQEYRDFFADQDFFDDFEEYRRRFSDYYEDRMSDFREMMERQTQELQERARDARDRFNDRREALEERVRPNED